ncbi:MAG: tripartite tricarboxylate transporter substrate binding protein [Clostridia bacterium]|nr:tripartite tricarboxylate transporter substrate binding protein [Clostridia bacterium]
MFKKTKIVSIILIVALFMTMLFTGCSSQDTSTNTDKDSEKSSSWPEKIIEVIVPYGAGGDTDFNARTYTKYLEDVLGVTVVVSNMTGSSGSIATREVKGSEPNGYRVLLANSALHVNEVSGITDFSWDEAFEIVAIGAKHSGDLLFVQGDAPYETLEDLIKDSQKRPGEITFGGDIGGTTHVIGGMLNKAGAEVTIVDQGGASGRLTGLKGGHVDIIPNPYGTMKDYVDLGDVKPLALLNDERNPHFSDIPTAIEQGHDVNMPKVYFFAMPKGTPQEIVDKLADALEEVSKMSEYQQDIEKAYYQQPFFLRGEEAARYMDEQRNMFMQFKDILR